MVPLSRSMWAMTWWFLIAVGCGLLVPSAATAGTYSVTQTCGAWQPFNNAPSRVAVYTECPKLIARNVGGAFNSGPGQEGRWEFWAPAGTSVERAFLGGSIGAYSGWQATILSSSGTVMENCPGFFCPGGAKGYGSTYSFANSAGIYLRVRCGADRCPNNEGLKVILDTNNVNIVINDGVPPGGGITGGDLLDGWRRGVGTVTFDHADNVGIRSDRILVDGTIRGAVGASVRRRPQVPVPEWTRLPAARHHEGVGRRAHPARRGGRRRRQRGRPGSPHHHRQHRSVDDARLRGVERLALDQRLRDVVAQPGPGARADRRHRVRAVPRHRPLGQQDLQAREPERDGSQAADRLRGAGTRAPGGRGSGCETRPATRIHQRQSKPHSASTTPRPRSPSRSSPPTTRRSFGSRPATRSPDSSARKSRSGGETRTCGAPSPRPERTAASPPAWMTSTYDAASTTSALGSSTERATSGRRHRGRTASRPCSSCRSGPVRPCRSAAQAVGSVAGVAARGHAGAVSCASRRSATDGRHA